MILLVDVLYCLQCCCFWPYVGMLVILSMCCKAADWRDSCGYGLHTGLCSASIAFFHVDHGRVLPNCYKYSFNDYTVSTSSLFL
jgi:hypothetical protein